MLLLLTDFEKGFVRTHTRKTGTVVQSHFTKRPPGKVQDKHLKERFYDHDKSSAKKAHEELETKKAHHQSVLNAVKKHHDELTKQGSGKDEEGVPHKTKIEHLKAEIKNQETHIDNHSRKQEHIKNRYEIGSKQVVRKKSKADLEKRIKDHSDEQKNTIRNIHKAHQEGRSNLEPGRVLTGKDKDHIYLESKHKETGKTHHIAIHKDGSVKDPQILHGGKFDAKGLEETRKEKKVVVKKPAEKPVVEKEKPPIKEEKKPEPEIPKREPKKVVVKKEKPKSEAEEKANRSRAMMGNKNAWKGGPKDEGKKVIVKKREFESPKTIEEVEKWGKANLGKHIEYEFPETVKTLSAINTVNRQLFELKKSSPQTFKYLKKINFNTGKTHVSGLGGRGELFIESYLTTLGKKEIREFNKEARKQHKDKYSAARSLKEVVTHEFGHLHDNQKMKDLGDDYSDYRSKILRGIESDPNIKKPSSYGDRKGIHELYAEAFTETIHRDKKDWSDATKIIYEKLVNVDDGKSRSEAMRGNKNAFKGGPREEKKIAVKKQDIAAFTRTKKELDGAQDKARTGKETMVITSRSKDKHKVRYKVIEADDNKLVASNHIDGKINKDYPSLDVKGALQMRDRSNIQSKAQITQMSNDLEPMFLTDSKIASDGAPIVGSDYKGKEGHSIVESGNGRVMAIRTAYENGKAGHYKEHLIDEAESFGIDPKTIKGMKNPILIRERVDKMSDEEKAKFAKESNKATVSQMTAVEQAIEDSNFLGQLTNLKATDSGRITHKNNSQFIKDFFSQVMDNDPREVGKLLNKDGQLNDEGERRLTNAVFTRVYGSHSDIMNKLIMKDTDKTKKITAGMLAAAPRMAQFKQTMQENDRHDLDISGNFIDALTAMEDLKREGITLEEKMQTVDWADLGVKEDFKNPLKDKDIVDILKMIQEHGTGLTGSANKISSLLTNYADEAEKAIFAEDPNKLTIEDAMGIARDKQMKVSKGEILKQAKDEVAFIQADRKGKKESYQKYLDEYPGGKFSAEAKEKLKKLSKPEEPDQPTLF